MLYIHYEIIKDIDVLLELVDKYKEEFDDKFIFVASSVERSSHNTVKFMPDDVIIPVTRFSDLYGGILNNLKKLVSGDDFNTLIYNYKIYNYSVLYSATKYVIVDRYNNYSYYDYIHYNNYTDIIDLCKKETPLFDKDPNLGIFFLSFVYRINRIITHISSMYTMVDTFSKNLVKNIFSAPVDLNNNVELEKYFDNICEYAKNYKKS